MLERRVKDVVKIATNGDIHKKSLFNNTSVVIDV